MVRFGKVGEFKVNGKSFGKSHSFGQCDTANDIKPGLKTDDPEDLLGYSKVNQSYPHDSTADQWFDEERFENYRKLGYISALAAEKELRDRIADALG